MSENPASYDNHGDSAPRETFSQGFVRRCRANRRRRWLRFAIVAAIYLAWVIWMNNYWFLLGLPLLFDIYITGYIPFTWWKKSKNRALRSVMSWVDAIVYALILVYFIFAFVGQNYQIPSSSLEKTLLVGDYLWVNKMVYGPRVPMTPVNFPLVHNKMPVLDCNSYSRVIENGYRRLPGLRDVESGDIVVFNFPAGDTVATKFEERPDYYEILVKKYGWANVNTDKATFGDVIYRPVDRRVNFVKRAVGLPGQRFRISGDTIYINGRPQRQPTNVQFHYAVALTRPFTEEQAREMGITLSDIQMPDGQDRDMIASRIPGATASDYIYLVPLTRAMKDSLKASGQLRALARVQAIDLYEPPFLFPEGLAENWTLSDYGGPNGFIIPKKGLTVPMNATTWALYRRAIRNYEGHTDSYLRDGKVYIDGRPADSYTFAMDYYFMMGDNRDLSQDSRFWGFVPEDHIVGTPMIVLASFDAERTWTDGKIRWNRILRSSNPDKK